VLAASPGGGDSRHRKESHLCADEDRQEGVRVNFKKLATVLCLGLFLASFSFCISEESTSKRIFYPSLKIVVIPIASDFLPAFMMSRINELSNLFVTFKLISSFSLNDDVIIIKPSESD
jgi:hypothetical protein